MAAEARRRALAWVPNAVTSTNLLLGFFSILASLGALRAAQGDRAHALATACWLILWAALGDVLDGKLAKLLKAGSDFGMYLDTFADAVSFGMAPAVLLYAAFLKDAGGSPFFALAPLGYFLAACFRLARYNVQTAGPARFGFVGVPTPTAALIATTFYLGFGAASPAPALVAGLTGVVAVLMVSPLRYPALKGLKGREALLILALLVAVAAASARWGVPKAVFFVFSSFAVVWGWWWISLRPYWVPGTTVSD
jgi:CDP-diacylglycerol---serine O-phosphatidyltransferase